MMVGRSARCLWRLLLLGAISVMASCGGAPSTGHLLPDDGGAGLPANTGGRWNGWYWHRQNESKGTCVPTYILIHGWNGSDHATGNEPQGLIQVADAILWRLDAESAFFDDASIAFWYWESAANTWDWTASYDATPEEGRKLAAELRQRMNNGEINADPDSVHIIGHSHGGYVGAIAGRYFKETAGKRLGQLSGLDVPAPVDEDYPPISNLVSDEFFRVVDWYPVTGPAGLQPIISDALDDTGDPNVINVVLQSGVDHSTVLDWYRDNCVRPGNPWISWVAPRVYPAPEISVLETPVGSLDYELSALGTSSWPNSSPAPPASAFGSAVQLDIPVVDLVGVLEGILEGGNVEIPTCGAGCQHDSGVGSGAFPGDSTASISGRVVSETIRDLWQLGMGSVAAVDAIWSAETWIGSDGLSAASHARVLYEVKLRVEADDCWTDLPVVVGLTSHVETSSNSSSAYNVTIAGDSSRVHTSSHTQQGASSQERRSELFCLPAVTDGVVSLTHTLDVSSAGNTGFDRQRAEVIITAFISPYALWLGNSIDPDEDHSPFLVTASSPFPVYAHQGFIDRFFAKFGVVGTVDWEQVIGPQVGFPLQPVAGLFSFTADEPGFYVFRATVSSNADGSAASVLTKIFVAGELTRGG